MMGRNDVSSLSQLRELFTQIHVMTSYAIGQGMAVPPDIVRDIAGLSACVDLQPSGSGSDGSDRPGSGSEDRAISGDVVKALPLAFAVHGKLATLVKPATPESLEVSRPRRGLERFRSLGVQGSLCIVTIVAVLLFLGGTWVSARSPRDVALAQVPYLGAALLGASFGGLYTAYKYLSARTFDPLYNSTYFVRLLLGTVSGLILADFGGYFIDPDNTLLKIVAPTALALVGGYSADAVNLILRRVADTFLAAVRGSGDDVLKAKRAQLQAENQAAEAIRRQQTAGELREILGMSKDPEAREAIQRLISAVGKGDGISGAVKGT